MEYGNKKLTVIISIFNEEYLLPFWLEFHKNIFDHGIVIDYHSTDRSMEIVRKFCPTWTIVTTKNKNYDAIPVDNEYMEYENTISGYKIVLNVTEFLLGPPNFRDFLSEKLDSYYPIRCITPLTSKETSSPNTLKELFDGIERMEGDMRRLRIIHSYNNGNYSAGRHMVVPSRTVTGIIPGYIVWFGFYPWNEHIVKRKLQIKNNITEEDRRNGHSFHHFWTEEDMKSEMMKLFNISSHRSIVPDFDSFVNSMLSKISDAPLI